MRVRTEERRELIIDIATQVFKEMGYERATMNEIANRCGGSKGTLYGYFASKEELFVAVVKASSIGHLSDAIKELSEASENEGDIEAVLLRFAERMLLVLTNRENDLDAVYRMVVAEAGRSDVGQLFYEAGPSECVAILGSLLDKAMVSGQIHQTDSNIMALQFIGLVTAETNVRLYQQEPPTVATSQIRLMAERAVEMFLLGAMPK